MYRIVLQGDSGEGVVIGGGDGLVVVVYFLIVIGPVLGLLDGVSFELLSTKRHVINNNVFILIQN